jgi:hypothetical protein
VFGVTSVTSWGGVTDVSGQGLGSGRGMRSALAQDECRG